MTKRAKRKLAAEILELMDLRTPREVVADAKAGDADAIRAIAKIEALSTLAERNYTWQEIEDIGSEAFREWALQSLSALDTRK